MSIVIPKDQIEKEDVIIEDCIVHARISCKELDLSGKKKLVVTYEIVEPVSDRKTGKPIGQTVRIDAPWMDLETDSSGNQTVAEKYLWVAQDIAKALQHTKENGDFIFPEDAEGKIVKLKIEYQPETASKDGSRIYAAKNRVKSVLPKDETFEEVPY